MSLAIGIDLGATKVAGALVNEQGEALAEARALTEAKLGVEPVIARIAEVVMQLLAQAPKSGAVLGIGIGTPGIVDGAAGIVRDAVNLGWKEVAIAGQVTAAVAAASGRTLPAWVENDANIQAVGELIFGAGRGLKGFTLITIGTGLGGGVITNRQLVAGASYAAAELGHLSLDPDQGRLCACGQRGCVETVVSGPGVVKTAQELIAQGQTSSLTPGFQAEDVVAAARSGDAVALAALAEAARWLGIVLAGNVALLNPDAIIIGGGLGLSAFDLIIPAARRELARYVLPLSLAPLQILPAQVMSSAVGAAALVWQNR